MTEKEFYVLAGKKFKSLREKSGLTQDDIAQKTGIDRTLISKFENTGKKISAFKPANGNIRAADHRERLREKKMLTSPPSSGTLPACYNSISFQR